MLGLGIFVSLYADTKANSLPTSTFSISAFFYILFAGLRERSIEIGNHLIDAIPATAPEIIEHYLPRAHWSGYLSLVAGPYLLAGLFHFAIRYLVPTGRHDIFWIRFIYTISTLFNISFVLTLYPIGKYTMVMTDPLTGHLKMRIFEFFTLYMIYVGIILLMVSVILIRKMLTAPAEYQNEAQSICPWICITAVMVFVFSTLLPVLGIFEYARFGRYSFILTFLGMFVAVTKYRAFNIRTAIHYTIYWIIVSAVVFIPPLGLLVASTPFINSIFHSQFTPLGLFGILFLSSIAVLLHFQWIQPKLNHRFFRRKFQLRDQAIDFAERISQINSTETLIRIIQTTFSDVLYTYHVQVILGNRDVIVEPGNITIPLALNDTLVGTILVGEKKNLTPYSNDELTFMHRISHQTAIFLNNAILFDELKSKNTQLVQVQNDLVHSEREKAAIEQIQIHTQELARGIIHEVKNTHFAVSNFVSLILNSTISNPSEIKTILSVIGEQSTKLHLFSKNYLHQELIRSKIYTLRTAKVSVTELISDAMQSNHFFIESNQLRITINIDPADHIFADKDKFHLVISNLINNAAKYQKFNHLTIGGQICTIYYELTFSSPLLKDHGNPYSENTTGLGLHVSKYIIEHHGGTIEIRSSDSHYFVQIKIPT